MFPFLDNLVLSIQLVTEIGTPNVVSHWTILAKQVGSVLYNDLCNSMPG